MPDRVTDPIAALLESEARLSMPVFSPDGSVPHAGSDGGLPPSVKPMLDLEREADLHTALKSRVWSISFAIINTLTHQKATICSGVEQMQKWIEAHEIVRVIGAGRALHAAAIPANRLAHAGADVHVINDVVPLPNSLKGGGIIAASASGRTPAVLEIMAKARERNSEITILGIADRQAAEFASLCDVFVGIEDVEDNPYDNPLRALADTGEYVISEVLDAMVVAAGKRLGLTDEDFRQGHEDLSPSGPYLPKKLSGTEH